MTDGAWIQIRRDTGIDDGARLLSEAIARIREGLSTVVACEQPDDDREREAPSNVELLREQLEPFGVSIIHRNRDVEDLGAPEARQALSEGFTAQTGAIAILVRRAGSLSISARTGLARLALASTQRSEHLDLITAETDLASVALTGTDHRLRPAVLVLLDGLEDVLTPQQTWSGGRSTTVDPRLDPARAQTRRWLSSWGPEPALRSAIHWLDLALEDGSAPATVDALDHLRMAQAMQARPPAAQAAAQLAARLADGRTTGIIDDQTGLIAAMRSGDRPAIVAASRQLDEALAAAEAGGESATSLQAVLAELNATGSLIGALDGHHRADQLTRDAGSERDVLATLEHLAATCADPGGDSQHGELIDALDHAAQTLVTTPIGAACWHHAVIALSDRAHRAHWPQLAEQLRASLTFFDVRGLTELARASRRALSEIGEQVPRRGRGLSTVPPELARFGVTSREMDVLALLCEELTNKEIAWHLYLSPRTVGHHVSQLLERTGCANRRELRELVARVGLDGGAPPMLR